jgi:hypothetical protein
MNQPLVTNQIRNIFCTTNSIKAHIVDVRFIEQRAPLFTSPVKKLGLA